jgi:hypothetical protein
MKYLILFLAVGFGINASAQSFSELETKKGNLYDSYTCGLLLRYTSFSDPYQETVKGLTANVAIRLGRSHRGGLSWDFENPTIGDFIYVLAHFKKATESTVDKSYGSGFVGWHQIYVNAVAKDRLIVAPGLSFGDYIFGIGLSEPNGYYFHLGPAVKVSYLLTDKMWIEGFIHHDIGFKTGKPGGAYQNIEGYEKPYFFNVGAKVFHTSRFFGGFRMSKLIDRGVNGMKATRIDVSVGYLLFL